MDHFKEAKSAMDIYNTKLDLPDTIPDSMPKYTKSLQEQLIESMREGFPKPFEDMTSPLRTDSFEENYLNTIKESNLLRAYQAAGMYAFVSWRWVNPFVEWISGRKVLEVMAGRGWLTHALRLKNVDVIGTDDFSWSDNRGWKEPLTDIERMDAIESVIKYGKDIHILVMAWPYMDNTAFRVIKKLNEVNPGAMVVYIGESGGGCTADEEFHNHFCHVIAATDQEKWDKVCSSYQQWQHLHDKPVLGRYCEEDKYV